MPILGVNAAAITKTFDQVCANCGQTHLTQPLASLVTVNPLAVPGLSGLSFTCPNCGAIECFNTNLAAADEGPEYRGQQAQRIRALMLLLALPRNNSVKPVL